MNDKCSICDSEIDEADGDIKGYFGICSISFCVLCMSSLTDMVIQLNDFNNIDTLKERIRMIKEDE